MTDATIVVVKDNYEELLQQFAALKVSRDNESLRRCFQFGKLYTEFYDSCGTAKYGGRRVDTLIKDLVERGYLEEMRDPRRFLYWSKNLYDFIETDERLSEYAEKGLTLSHAKLLFPCTPAVVRQVEKKMCRDGKVISTAELQTLVLAEARVKSIETVDDECSLKEVESSVVSTEMPKAPAEAVSARPAAETPGNPELPVPKSEPRAEAAKEKAESGETPTATRAVSPLKAINGLERTISKVVIDLPDALIAIKEKTKEGFDSDTAEKRFKEAVANLKAAIKDSLEPLKALLQEITDSE